ncbi:phiSA1p31-related protein [Streptomyces sp. NPDC058375]|uniref:phiSA1p31-related protein n=1 Tax=Streptomyces sp. NPDC058375 TaxID=3346467 RepID=UPI00365BEB67
MSEFKVGETVRVLIGGEGVITYGPVNSTFGDKVYVVKQDGDDERAFKSSDLEPTPTFAVGDKVALDTRGGEQATVEYGPFDGENVYVVKLAKRPTDGNPRTFTVLAGMMRPVTEPGLVPVGTRVRVDRAKWAGDQHGETGVIRSNTETWTPHDDVAHVYEVELDNGGSIAVAEVTPVDEPANGYEYEGVTYERHSTYRDKDGDYWEFARPDEAVNETDMMRHVDPLGEHDGFRYSNESLRSVLARYGPLTKQ